MSLFSLWFLFQRDPLLRRHSYPSLRSFICNHTSSTFKSLKQVLWGIFLISSVSSFSLKVLVRSLVTLFITLSQITSHQSTQHVQLFPFGLCSIVFSWFTAYFSSSLNHSLLPNPHHGSHWHFKFSSFLKVFWKVFSYFYVTLPLALLTPAVTSKILPAKILSECAWSRAWRITASPVVFAFFIIRGGQGT